MSEPEFDSENPDTESMFDFLAEEGKEKRAQRKPKTAEPERALPIIRKPVPISESGPLLPPKPGSAVEPPPQLTASKPASAADDLSFLEDVQQDATVLRPARTPLSDEQAPDNVTRLRQPDRFQGLRQGSSQRLDQKQADDGLDLGLDDLGLDDLEDDLSFDSDWREGHSTESALSGDADSKRRRFRGIALAVALLMIIGGVGSYLFSEQLGLTGFSFTRPGTDSASSEADSSLNTDAERAISAVTGESEAPSDEIEPLSDISNVQPSPLMTRFRTQLAELEELVIAGSLDEADQLLTTMDRTVYGYGAFEFGEIEVKIDRIRSGESIADVMATQATVDASGNDRVEDAVIRDAEQLRVEQERLAQQAAEVEAARVEQERLAQQAAEAEAARVEQERLAQQAAEVEAARVEQERLAQQAAEAEAARVEQERLAQQAAEAEAARVEQERLAQQAAEAEAARVEQERVAQQAAEAEAARVEQERLAQEIAQAEAARLEQARIAEQARRSAEADRQATDRRIAEERAAAQRQQARELRLQQAREREAARAEAEQLAARQAEEARREEQAAQLLAAEQRAAERLAAERLAAQQRAADQQAQAQAAQNEQNTAAQTQADTSVASINPVITDEDLQLVYRRFADLQQAVRDRDINAVVGLTQRSGIRVQQFMQMFENSIEIDARIRNVSTRNATGEINGTLQIRKIRRADGSVTEPPANLASVRLSSKRESSGWSAIRW